MPSDSVIHCSHVGRHFANPAGGETRVLQDIDLDIRTGELVVLIGPSGCGKSTLLNIIAGFDRPNVGAITVRGRPVIGPGPDRAMVFQDYALLPWLNARENVALGLRLQGMRKAERLAVADEMLALVGLGQVTTRPVYKLSGGMQQRVSIARALVLKPAVLLMDEPFGALDAFQRAVMHRELLHIWKATGATILFVTHSLEEALFLGTRVVAMSPGQVGLTGEVVVDLPMPRAPLSAEFSALKQSLYAMISAHAEQPEEAFIE